MNVKDLIIKSYNEAKSVNVVAEPEGERNRQRSMEWIKALAQGFQEMYDNDSVVVFSRGNPDNRVDFKINELLHDITVCSISKVKAARHDTDLSYITKAHWQVESEFAKDSREAVIDFNKLVLGSADNKLFIGPIVYDQESFKETLAAPARMCSGNVYAAFIPHPGDWDDNNSKPEIFQFIGDKWVII